MMVGLFLDFLASTIMQSKFPIPPKARSSGEKKYHKPLPQNLN